MKLIHLSDLHLGKRLYERSFLEDQKYILEKILDIIDEEKPDAILLSGDIYDKSLPSEEAISIFDDFLVSIMKKEITVFCISGNHDSCERLSFGSEIMGNSGIHIAKEYDGNIASYVLSDEYGEVNFYLMPFVKLGKLKLLFDDNAIESLNDGMRLVIDKANLDKSKRNVLLLHQYITGGLKSDSEESSVGGLDNINAEVFRDFDYTALGHLHRPQNVDKNIRYCGSPLCYSFSEIDHKKSVTIVELREKGDVKIIERDLIPLREFKEIKGTFDEITDKQYYEGKPFRDSYLHVILTDEYDIPNAQARLREIYTNVLALDYDNSRTRSSSTIGTIKNLKSKSPIELISELYKMQNKQDLLKEQVNYINDYFNNIGD